MSSTYCGPPVPLAAGGTAMSRSDMAPALPELCSVRGGGLRSNNPHVTREWVTNAELRGHLGGG